jgi:putative ABC transport system permease protein
MRDYVSTYSMDEDLNEIYQTMVESRGRFRAALWYWLQSLGSFPEYLKLTIHWRTAMFGNYVKSAIRNLTKHKGFSLINISGLAVGMACCILILLYVRYETSFDKFHKNSEGIYRVLINIGGTYRGKSRFNVSSGVLASAMKDNFPEVLHAARVFKHGRVDVSSDANKRFTENRFYFADPDFLKIFTFPLIEGNPDSVLNEPFTTLVSRTAAKKYFGNRDPIGETISVNSQWEYLITGIFEDTPENSHLHFDFLASFSSHIQIQGEERFNDWRRFTNVTYFMIDARAYVPEFEKKLDVFYKQNLGPEKTGSTRIEIQPLRKIHFYDQALDEFEPGTDIRTVYIFSAIAFFILLIASFNYMNLSTARSSLRHREVGLRKVVGASRQNLIKQFFGESILVTFISFLASLLLIHLILPKFSSYIGKPLSFQLLADPLVLVSIGGILVFIALVSGSYPALLLSSISPLGVLKGKSNLQGRGPFRFRNLLVMFQFSISIALVFCMSVTINQLRFIKNRDLGFVKDFVLTLNASQLFEERGYEAVKNELMTSSGILDMTCSSYLPVNIGSGGPVDWEGKPEEDTLVAHMIWVDENFFDFYGIPIVQGRNFSKEFGTDTGTSYILNEKAVKEIGWTEPIGKRFSVDADMKAAGPVIGVVKDFHFQPLHLEIQPLHIRYLDEPWGWLSLRLNPQSIPETLAFLEKKWSELAPKYTFEYSFLDERLDRLYASEEKLGQSFNGFAFLAILIACLGLFGLASFVTERRTKEIGIRKVLGASSPQLLVLLSRDFLKWVIMANVIAWPVATYAMSKWLQNFAYHVPLSLWIYLLSGLSAFFIAFIVVCSKSLRAAASNPVESLRYE